MNSFIEYIIKSGFSLTLLYLLYWLVLKNDTHFRLNRIILLLSLVFSFVLPAIRLDILPVTGTQNILSPFDVNFVEPVGASEQVLTDAPNQPLNVWKIITLIYLTGMGVVVARLIYQAIYLQAVSRLSDKQKMNGFTLISMNTDTMPFSYFKRIFLPTLKIDEFSANSIINHEKSHLAQHHYLDLFIIETMAVLHWFNPFIWFYEKSLKEVHEFLADEAVLSTGENAGKYKAILVNQAMGGPVFVFTNQFNQSLIKKRILMMNKLKSPRRAQLKALLFVPLMAALMVAFAHPKTSAQTAFHGKQIIVTGQVTDQTTGEGIPGSAVIIKGTTIGTLTDAKGEYSIEVNDPYATLVFSIVGYRTEEIPLDGHGKINVELQVDVLALDFSAANKTPIPRSQEETVAHTDEPIAHDKDLYVAVEENPSYPGGMEALYKFIQANLQYPESARQNKVEGTVLVQYTIDKEGAVRQAKVMRGVSPELDLEALRVTNLITGWKPATQNGKHLKRVVTMPVQFLLP
jgi:bla regulator protein blaR1